MEIQEDIRDEVAILRLTGQFVSGLQVGPLQDRVKQLSTDGVTNVVLDLSGVRWFGSAMLGVMSSCFVILQEAGGGMRLTGLTPKVLDILKVTRLLPVFNPVDSVEEAVASFQE